ncbi:MAG TPA: VOC family protein [Caulobacteraceae bacterium]
MHRQSRRERSWSGAGVLSGRTRLPDHNYADGDDFILFQFEGSWLSLYPREAALKDLPAGSTTFSSVGLSHNVASPAEVDAVFELGLSVGATPLKRPQATHWGGYEAAFADPDGHVWDIAFNPFTDLT